MWRSQRQLMGLYYRSRFDSKLYTAINKVTNSFIQEKQLTITVPQDSFIVSKVCNQLDAVHATEYGQGWSNLFGYGSTCDSYYSADMAGGYGSPCEKTFQTMNIEDWFNNPAWKPDVQQTDKGLNTIFKEVCPETCCFS